MFINLKHIELCNKHFCIWNLGIENEFVNQTRISICTFQTNM